MTSVKLKAKAPGVGVVVGGIVGGAAGCVIGLFGGGYIQDAWDNLIGQGVNYYTSMQGIPYDAQKLKDMGCTTIQSVP